MHDPLAISERLKQAGLPEPVAMAIALEIISTVENKAATIADVREIVYGALSDFRKEFHAEMMELRKDM